MERGEVVAKKLEIGWRVQSLLRDIESVYYTQEGFTLEEIAFLRDNLTQYDKETYAQESARWAEQDVDE